LDESAPHITKEVETTYYCSTLEGSPRSYIEGGDITGLELDPSDYYDNCGVDSIFYRVYHVEKGLIQDWTTGDPLHPGNAAWAPDGSELPFYVGTNKVYFRLTDELGNDSEDWDGADGKHCFSVVVYELPIPGEIND
jgi:hypothetical protein